MDKAALQRLYHHASEPKQLAAEALVLRMCSVAGKLRRQVGVLIDRNGRVTHVLVGDDHELLLPDLGRFGQGSGRLRGLRLVHIHLRDEPLSEDDLNDLMRLGLDLVAAIGLVDGGPGRVFLGHLAAQRRADLGESVVPHELVAPCPWYQLDLDVAELIASLEADLQRARTLTRVAVARERALLVHVSSQTRAQAEDQLDELDELARTARVEVVGRVLQRRQKIDARTLIGAGKLNEISLKAMQTDATMLVFDCELTPSQSKSIAQQVELKVLDRTQLILDIFAGRAKSQDGRLQVELAQLRYSLPRLGDRDNALSRLTGGIGGVGPGETKLEVDRRRARDRVHRLQDQLEKLRRGRGTRRKERGLADVGLCALVGYTNVGKSSLLNAITKSDAYTENLLFATLDPTSRRLRLPDGQNVVLTDTVGFIRDLPKELLGAFEATLEEAKAAAVLVLVLDASHAQIEQQYQSVLKILADHELADHPRLVVINKADAVLDLATVRDLVHDLDALLVSATTRENLDVFLDRLGQALVQAQVPSQQDAVEPSEDEPEWSPLDS